MPNQNRIVTVFGSSRPRPGDADYEEARVLGAALAVRGFAVCSGGYAGVMEAVSRGAKEAGGRTLAVTAGVFSLRANSWIDEESAVSTWEERLFELIRRGHGFVACKGGTGTLVELAAVWEMLNKGFLQDKPFVVLGDFWVPILERVREVELEHRPAGELASGSRKRWNEAGGRLVHHAPTPEEAAELLAQAFALRA